MTKANLTNAEAWFLSRLSFVSVFKNKSDFLFIPIYTIQFHWVFAENWWGLCREWPRFESMAFLAN